MGRTACTEPQCLYSTAIPLLPLWAVRSVQSLSACTVEVYLYSPYGSTACTEPQCLCSTAIPLLPLWAVRPVQSLNACTRMRFTFTFTSMSFSAPLHTGPGAHPASCTMGTGSLPGVKNGRGVTLTTYPFLVPLSWKSRAIPLPNLWATQGMQRDRFTFITYTECVFVDLSMQQTMRMRHTVACGLSGCTIFSTLFHKWHDFRGKK